jgi:hypothetical protein
VFIHLYHALPEDQKLRYLKKGVFWGVAPCRTDVSEEGIASIFRVEEKSASEEPA